MSREDAYLEQLQSLLPPGRAWPKERDTTLTDILRPIAFELLNAESRANQLVNEADPRTTFEMLEDWERVAGLPDNCSQAAQTLQERLSTVLQKITSTGGQSIAFFKAAAETLGYNDIQIIEFRPAVCGVARCADRLDGPHSVRNFWKVIVPDARLTYARTSLSRAGDKLLSISRALDLECLFNYLKPAHTTLIFSYEGV